MGHVWSMRALSGKHRTLTGDERPGVLLMAPRIVSDQKATVTTSSQYRRMPSESSAILQANSSWTMIMFRGMWLKIPPVPLGGVGMRIGMIMVCRNSHISLVRKPSTGQGVGMGFSVRLTKLPSSPAKHLIYNYEHNHQLHKNVHKV